MGFQGGKTNGDKETEMKKALSVPLGEKGCSRERTAATSEV